MAPPFLKSVYSHAVAVAIGASSTITILKYYGSKNADVDGHSASVHKLKNHVVEEEERNPLDGDGARRNVSRTQTSLTSISKLKSTQLPFIRSPITIFQPNPDLEIAYDARTKNPVYVLERLHLHGKPPSPAHHKNETQSQSDPIPKPNRANHTFHEPKSIPPHHRPRNGYYRNSGFDRGHMAAAANCNYNSSGSSRDVGAGMDLDAKMKDTFSLANVSPQHPVLNRVVWRSLEDMTRNLLKNVNADLDEVGGNRNRNRKGRQRNEESGLKKGRTRKEAFVITGPVWLPTNVAQSSSDDNDSSGQRTKLRDLYQYSHVGFGTPPQLIHVPTHFFKVIFTISSSGIEIGRRKNEDVRTNTMVKNVVEEVQDFAAFVVPNHSFEGVDSVNLQDFIVRLTDLEAVTGITFFPEKQGRDEGSSLVEVFDLITEQVWMKDNVNINNFDEKRDPFQSAITSTSTSSPMLSKKRIAKIKKKIRDMEKDGSLPKHLCLRGSCDQNVRIWKK